MHEKSQFAKLYPAKVSHYIGYSYVAILACYDSCDTVYNQCSYTCYHSQLCIGILQDQFTYFDHTYTFSPYLFGSLSSLQAEEESASYICSEQVCMVDLVIGTFLLQYFLLRRNSGSYSYVHWRDWIGGQLLMKHKNSKRFLTCSLQLCT